MNIVRHMFAYGCERNYKSMSRVVIVPTVRHVLRDYRLIGAASQTQSAWHRSAYIIDAKTARHPLTPPLTNPHISTKTPVEPLHQPAYATFRENYISKAAAQRLRHMLQTNVGTLRKRNWDALLARAVEQTPTPPSPAPPMFYKRYFDYLPATDALDGPAAAVELEPLDVEFEPLLDGADGSPADDEWRAPFVEPVPAWNDDDVVAVNRQRSKRDLRDDYISR